MTLSTSETSSRELLPHLGQPRISWPTFERELRFWVSLQPEAAAAELRRSRLHDAARDWWQDSMELQAFTALRLDHYAALSDSRSVGALRLAISSDFYFMASAALHAAQLETNHNV